MIGKMESDQVTRLYTIMRNAMMDFLSSDSLNKRGVQKLVENEEELWSRIILAMNDLSVCDQHIDEEVYSTCEYPLGYSILPIQEQVFILANLIRKYLPDVELETEKTFQFIETALPGIRLPEGAEGWFAIIRWDKIAPVYSEATERILALLGDTRIFHNHRAGQLSPGRLRQSKRSIKFWKRIMEQQEGDILIVPAQFGRYHRGRSSRRAMEVFLPNEFGLGVFAISCMLLTHPLRLQTPEGLDIDCSGDEYDRDDDGTFVFELLFNSTGDMLYFDAAWTISTSEGYGPVSGFIAESTVPDLVTVNN
jgi:hypothetical protein